MGEEPHDDLQAMEDEHAEHNDDQQYVDVYEQGGQEDADYDDDVYDNINGQADAGNTLPPECTLPSRSHVCFLILPDAELRTDLTFTVLSLQN